MAKWERFELRLSEEQFSAVKRTAQIRGFRSVSGYIQSVLTRDLRDSPPDQSDREAFVAASLDLRKGSRFLLTQHFVEPKTELLRHGAPFKKMKTLFMKVGFMLQPKVLRY
jgi:hypothetical protein